MLIDSLFSILKRWQNKRVKPCLKHKVTAHYQLKTAKKATENERFVLAINEHRYCRYFSSALH